MGYEAVLFDMDGTVLNTLEDLRDAMNVAMQQAGHRHDYTIDDAGLVFGSGVEVSVQRTLSLEKGMEKNDILKLGTPEGQLSETIDHDEVRRIVQLFRTYYDEHCADKTRPYSGIVDLLDELRKNGIKTAVVSNKPDSAVKILAKVHFEGLFDLAVGQRDDVRRKPYPDMTLHALQELGCPKEKAVYVGDTEVDIQTAQNAHLDCIVVNWGFRDEAYLRECGAKRVVSTAEELLLAISNTDITRSR